MDRPWDDGVSDGLRAANVPLPSDEDRAIQVPGLPVVRT